MPASFSLDLAARVVRSRAWGHLTEDDLVTHMTGLRRLFEDGTIDAGWAQIMDLSEVESLGDASTDVIRRIALANPWPAEAKRAFIAPTDLLFGLGRMYQLMGGEKGDQMCVVRSESEAVKWIRRERSASSS